MLEEHQESQRVPVAQSIETFVIAGNPGEAGDLTPFIQGLLWDIEFLSRLQIPDFDAVCACPRISSIYTTSRSRFRTSTCQKIAIWGNGKSDNRPCVSVQCCEKARPFGYQIRDEGRKHHGGCW
jgi:hypothetical protein